MYFSSKRHLAFILVESTSVMRKKCQNVFENVCLMKELLQNSIFDKTKFGILETLPIQDGIDEDDVLGNAT